MQESMCCFRFIYPGPTDISVHIDISIFNSCRVAQHPTTLIHGNFLSKSLLMVFKVVSTWLANKNNAAVIIPVFTAFGISKSISTG